MVNKDTKKLLKTIHALIIEARRMAGDKKNHEDIFYFLDMVEYLPALIMEENDRTNLFEEYLLETCQRYDCMRAYNIYCSTNP